MTNPEFRVIPVNINDSDKKKKHKKNAEIITIDQY